MGSKLGSVVGFSDGINVLGFIDGFKVGDFEGFIDGLTVVPEARKDSGERPLAGAASITKVPWLSYLSFGLFVKSVDKLKMNALSRQKKRVSALEKYIFL